MARASWPKALGNLSVVARLSSGSEVMPAGSRASPRASLSRTPRSATVRLGNAAPGACAHFLYVDEVVTVCHIN